MTTIVVDAVAKFQEGDLIELVLQRGEQFIAMTAWDDSTLEEIAFSILNQQLPIVPSKILQKRFTIEAHKELDPEGFEYWVVDSVEAVELPRDEAKLDFSNLPGWASWTGQEASDWIESNVTDLESAKTVLQSMARAIVYLRDYVRIISNE